MMPGPSMQQSTWGSLPSHPDLPMTISVDPAKMAGPHMHASTWGSVLP